MSGDNRTSGPTNIYNIPNSAYQDYARTEQQLEGTRQMQGGQGPDVARRGAQLIDTVIKPSAFDALFGITQKGQPVKVDPPPGYDNQLAPLNVNAEILFGSTSHIASLQSAVANAEGDPAQKETIKNFLQKVMDDMSAKNGVLARRGSLQQG